jgi:hypothetical protein
MRERILQCEKDAADLIREKSMRKVIRKRTFSQKRQLLQKFKHHKMCFFVLGVECSCLYARGGGGPQGSQTREPSLLQVFH